MTNATTVQHSLSVNDITDLVNELGGSMKYLGNDIVFSTICHNDDGTGKHKMYYYPDKAIFHCYTGCGSFNIYGLLEKVFGFEFREAFLYVCDRFNIVIDNSIDYNDPDRLDFSFTKKFNNKQELVELNVIDDSVMDRFYDIYHRSWIDDGISIDTMKDFNIKFDVEMNRIIIPHYDSNGNLIGVRARNLDKEIVDRGLKYIPIRHKNEMLRHPTGANLYAFDVNKEQIKKHKKAILFESEKATQQLRSYHKDFSIGVGISGSSFQYQQLKLLIDNGVEEIVIGVDKDFHEIGDNDEKYLSKKIMSMFVNMIRPYCNVSIMWDCDNLLDYQDSPTDKGKEVFDKLFKDRIYL